MTFCRDMRWRFSVAYSRDITLLACGRCQVLHRRQAVLRTEGDLVCKRERALYGDYLRRTVTVLLRHKNNYSVMRTAAFALSGVSLRAFPLAPPFHHHQPPPRPAPSSLRNVGTSTFEPFHKEPGCSRLLRRTRLVRRACSAALTRPAHAQAQHEQQRPFRRQR